MVLIFISGFWWVQSIFLFSGILYQLVSERNKGLIISMGKWVQSIFLFCGIYMETWLARRGLYKRKQVHFSCPVIGPTFRPGARYGSWVEGLGGWLGYEKGKIIC